MSEMVERAAREIARTHIPAYADDKVWREDLPMYRRRLDRGGVSGVDNPIGTARAALLVALDFSEDSAGFNLLCTAIAVADDGHPDGLKYREQTKAAIRALHDLVRSPQEIGGADNV